MPCMKDYNTTWTIDALGNHVPISTEIILKDGQLQRQPRALVRYRKVANQYGVCKFVRRDG